MPCYENNTISIELKNADRDLLSQTLDELGVEAIYRDNQLTLSERNEGRIAEIKTKYAEKLLTKIAKEKRWSLKKKEDKKFTLTR